MQSNPSGAAVSDDPFTPAMTYAWNWFSLHSNQRMQLVNFWIVAMAFMAAAFAAVSQKDLWWISSGLAFCGLATTYAFAYLELRTRVLIDIGRDALRTLEVQLMLATGMPSMNLAQTGKANGRNVMKYKHAIGLLHAVIGSAWLAATIYAMAKAF
jgi:hypothetical protein